MRNKIVQRVAVYTRISVKAQDYIRQLMELREFTESRRRMTTDEYVDIDIFYAEKNQPHTISREKDREDDIQRYLIKENRRGNVRLWWKCLTPHPDLLNPPILNDLSL